MIGDRCAYLGLDAIQIERLGRNVSLWISNFKTKSFCWKRLALFDVGTGPQQNLKKRQKIISTLDVSYALRHLQASLHHLKRSLHVNQEMTFHFSMIDNQNTWMKHDVTFTCMRLLSSRFFRSNPVAADQHVDTAGGGQSSEIGSLPCTNLYTMIFETLRTCIHSTWKMGFMGCLLILCQFDCWYGLHATMRQAVMIWHSSKVIGSPVFWIMLWEDKHCNSQKFKIKTWKQLPGLQYQLLSFAALPSCRWDPFLRHRFLLHIGRAGAAKVLTLAFTDFQGWERVWCRLNFTVNKTVAYFLFYISAVAFSGVSISGWIEPF